MVSGRLSGYDRENLHSRKIRGYTIEQQQRQKTYSTDVPLDVPPETS